MSRALRIILSLLLAGATCLPCAAARAQGGDRFDGLVEEAIALTDSCRYPEALKPALEALQIALDQDDDDLRAEVFSCLSTIYFRIGVYDKAIVYATRCYEYDRLSGNKENISSSLSNLAAIYVANSTYKPVYGLRYILEAVKIERELGRRMFLARRLGLASELYCAMGDYDNAEKCAREALEIDETDGRADNAAIRRSQLAACLFHKGRTQEAEKECLDAISVFNENGNSNSASITYNLLGCLARSRGETVSARNYYVKAVELTESTGNLGQRLKSLNALASLMDGPNPAEACTWYRQAAELRDSINCEKALQQTQRYEVEAELQQKEEIIALQSQQVSFQKKELLFFIIILVIAVLTIGALGYFFARMRRMNKELRDVNKMKDRFLSIVSHDLRSPAIAQQTAAHMLVDNYDKLNSQQHHEICLGLSRLADAHVDLVENLLQWARFQLGQGPKVVKVRFNLGNAAHEAVETHLQIAAQKEIECMVDAPEGVFVTTDRNITLTIVRNLLSNAIKFTRRGGKVCVKVEPGKSVTKVKVIDNGIGMSEEDMAQIFTPGGKRSSAGTEKESGSGMGLVVARELAKNCGCELSVRSRLGEGTEFTLSIPEHNG